MFLNDMMNEKHMTRADLCRKSGLPESTLRNILNGNTQLDHCEAATLLCLANVLDTTVEDLLCKYWAECEGEEEPEKKPVHDGENPEKKTIHDDDSLLHFYMIYEASLFKLSQEGDIGYIREICDNRWIERFFLDGEYRIALFQLGLVDHLCNKHHRKLDPRYDEIRKLCLDQPVYSLSTLEKYDDPDACKKAMAHAESNAIPELARFNIFLTREDIGSLN